ncbi:MAG TPA: hypothetical protein DHV90_02455 [Lactobacillus sp.]|nr:hypothetical protein [Lactobacillus sp.]
MFFNFDTFFDKCSAAQLISSRSQSNLPTRFVLDVAGAYAKTGLDLQLIEIITGFNLRHSFSSYFDSNNIDQSSGNFVNNQQMPFERESGLRSD